jgi:hypothetical protein
MLEAFQTAQVVFDSSTSIHIGNATRLTVLPYGLHSVRYESRVAFSPVEKKMLRGNSKLTELIGRVVPLCDHTES